jgi:NAD(P)-dependent dehydrogenase (short-subunit alcohol dehydrogenase family)
VSQRLKQLMDMNGRKVLVTGAAGMLGQVMCETLLEIGAHIIAVDRVESQLNMLVDPCKSLEIIYCDLEQQSQRDMLAGQLKYSGRLDVLINNAAFVGSNSLEGWATPFELQSVETWRRALEVNLTSAFDLSRQLTALLRASKHGNIINIGSIYGSHCPDWSLYEDSSMANPAAYAVSKGGLLQLTRWLATTLAPHRRVHSISPGGIARGQPESFVKRYEKRTPLNRMATEDDFRGAVAYLASDMSGYVTGQNLCVDGGWGTW